MARTAVWLPVLLVCALALAFFVAVFFVGAWLVSSKTFSGTSVPAEAVRLSEDQRWQQTRARAETIRAAVLAFESRTGRLPASLQQLGAELPVTPAPLTSTMPFRYEIAPNGLDFTIKWEMFPNAMYEASWIDRAGELHSDG